MIVPDFIGRASKGSAVSNESKKKAQAATAAMQGKDKKRRTLIQIGIAVVLVALIAAIGFSIASKNSDSDAPAAAPSSTQDNGAIRIGDPNAAVVVSVVEDFQCPACKQVESISGDTLAELVADNTIAVDYRPIAILDRMSSTNYSTRAANASLCVAEADSSAWPAWHKMMFDQQPAEGAAGLSDDELVAITRLAGIESPELSSCITDGTYTDYVTSQTKAALDEGISSTPTVSVNGTVVSNPTPDGLRAAITAAQ